MFAFLAAGDMRQSYGEWASGLTLEALKRNKDVVIQVHKSAEMKMECAKWISQGIDRMNESKTEKIVHCWTKTGLLEAFIPASKAKLIKEAFEKRLELFPNMKESGEERDTSGERNQIDDNLGDLNFSDTMVTTVNFTTGENCLNPDDTESCEVPQSLLKMKVDQLGKHHLLQLPVVQGQELLMLKLLKLMLSSTATTCSARSNSRTSSRSWWSGGQVLFRN